MICNSIVSTGFYLQERGVSLSDLSGLPKTLGGLPKGCVQRLSGAGIIARAKGNAGRIYKDRALRVIWHKGHGWERLEKWVEENDVR